MNLFLPSFVASRRSNPVDLHNEWKRGVGALRMCLFDATAGFVESVVVVVVVDDDAHFDCDSMCHRLLTPVAAEKCAWNVTG